jgi:class 3 adenylate cyclase
VFLSLAVVGYCTVGNFGSEDRMDYTIVGGAVKLAPRLDHGAPPGGVLISYKTHAHVKDEWTLRRRAFVGVTPAGMACLPRIVL